MMMVANDVSEFDGRWLIVPSCVTSYRVQRTSALFRIYITVHFNCFMESVCEGVGSGLERSRFGHVRIAVSFSRVRKIYAIKNVQRYRTTRKSAKNNMPNQ